MSEIENLVLPILQKIQGDLSALRAKADDIAESQLSHGEKLEEIRAFSSEVDTGSREENAIKQEG